MTNVRMLVYGSSGVGKTVFCSTAIDCPATSPTVWVDFENRTSSIRSKVRRITAKELGDPQPGLIDVVNAKSVQDLQDVYDKLFAFGNKNPYKCLVLDSLSEINAMFLSRVRAGGDAKATPLRLEALARVSEERMFYGPTQRMILDMLRGFRDMENMHILCTALPQEAIDPVDDMEKVMPMLTGKLRQVVVSMMDICAYYDTQGQKRIMRFQPKGRIIAKCAIEGNTLGDSAESPTVGYVMEKISYA